MRARSEDEVDAAHVLIRICHRTQDVLGEAAIEFRDVGVSSVIDAVAGTGSGRLTRAGPRIGERLAGTQSTFFVAEADHLDESVLLSWARARLKTVDARPCGVDGHDTGCSHVVARCERYAIKIDDNGWDSQSLAG